MTEIIGGVTGAAGVAEGHRLRFFFVVFFFFFAAAPPAPPPPTTPPFPYPSQSGQETNPWAT